MLLPLLWCASADTVASGVASASVELLQADNVSAVTMATTAIVVLRILLINFSSNVVEMTSVKYPKNSTLNNVNHGML